MGTEPSIATTASRQRNMSEAGEDKLLGFLKRHPHIVERYIREHCTQSQVSSWAEQLAIHTTDEEVQAGAARSCKEEGLRIYDIMSRETLACYAAEIRKAVNLADLPEDVKLPRLENIPEQKGVHALAYPIVNARDEVIAVIELYRLPTRKPFLEPEKKMIELLIHWTELVLEGDERLVAAEKAQGLSDFILEVIRNFFSKVKNMNKVIKAIMEHAKELVKAERVTLFLVDQKKKELYSSILDIGDVTKANFVQDESLEIRIPLSEGIAGYVARTGEGIRANDVYSDSRFCRKIDETYNQVTRTALAMPLTDGKEVMGVLEIINKHNGIFTEEDEYLMRVYSIYCGLAINVARMYDRIYRSDRKYRVALEVLTYHSCVSEIEVGQIAACNVPKMVPGISNFDFSPWDVEENREIPVILHMMYDLAGKLTIDKKTLVRFVLTIRKNYRPVAYHNWDHGLSVAHSMYYLLTLGDNQYSALEKICLFIASMCHDLDHRGYDNRFMKKYSTPLASLYSSSPMEHHHFNMTITILQILGIIKHAILSTDLATFWTSKGKLDKILDSENGLDWNDQNHRMAVVSIAMPTSDLCAMYKPWDIQVKVVMLIMQEFWAQGDREKASDSKPLSLMDRDEAVQLADGQVGFIRAICLPCYSTMARVFPKAIAIVEMAQKNVARWEAISKLSYEEREDILRNQLEQRFSKVEGRSRN